MKCRGENKCMISCYDDDFLANSKFFDVTYSCCGMVLLALRSQECKDLPQWHPRICNFGVSWFPGNNDADKNFNIKSQDKILNTDRNQSWWELIPEQKRGWLNMYILQIIFVLSHVKALRKLPNYFFCMSIWNKTVMDFINLGYIFHSPV